MDDCNCCVVLVPGGGRNSRLNATESFCVVTAAHNVCVGRGGGQNHEEEGEQLRALVPQGDKEKVRKKNQTQSIHASCSAHLSDGDRSSMQCRAETFPVSHRNGERNQQMSRVSLSA
jgi:hypothetical protein